MSIPYIHKVKEFDITEYHLDEDIELERAFEFDEIYNFQVSNAEFGFDDNEIFQQEFTKSNLEDYIYEIEVIKDGVTRFIGVVDIESLEPDKDTDDWEITLINWYKYFYDNILSETTWAGRTFNNLEEFLGRAFFARDNIIHIGNFYHEGLGTYAPLWKGLWASGKYLYYSQPKFSEAEAFYNEIRIDVTGLSEFRFSAYANNNNGNILSIVRGEDNGQNFYERPILAQHELTTTPQEIVVYPQDDRLFSISIFTVVSQVSDIDYLDFLDFRESTKPINRLDIQIAVTNDQSLKYTDILDIQDVAAFDHLIKEFQKYYNALIYIDEDRALNFRHRSKVIDEAAFDVDNNLIDDKEILIKKYTNKPFDGVIISSGFHSVLAYNEEHEEWVPYTLFADTWIALWYDKFVDFRGSYLKKRIVVSEEGLTSVTQNKRLIDLRQAFGLSGNTLSKELGHKLFPNRLDTSAIQDYQDVLYPYEQVKCTVDIENSKPKLLQEATYNGHSYIIWRINENVDAEEAEIEIRRNLIDVELDAPVNVQITDITEQSFTVSWDAVENADGYLFEISTDENFTQLLQMEYDGDSGSEAGDTLLIAETGFITANLLDTSIDVAGLSPLTTYYVRVRAYDN